MKFSFKFPDMKEKILPNGMRSIWLPDFAHPVITVSLLIPAGRYADPVGLEGISELTVGLMQKGTKSLPAEAFSEKLEQTGASIVMDVKDECITIGVRMLHKAASEIIPLFWDMICNPALDKSEFKRLKKEMITGLNAEYADPGALAGKHFNAELFGPLNPAGRKNTLYTVKNINLEHIKNFYSVHIAPQDANLIIAGAMKVEDMQKKWESLFSNWDNKKAEKSTYEIVVPDLTKNRIRIIDKPELSQTTILLGHPCVNELHEKRITLALANFILGGGNFSSRLMSRIRSDTGKTYGIASQIFSNRKLGSFMISTSTQNNQLREVISSIFDVYNDFTKKGATEPEIEKAKQFATGNMAFELEGINNIVEKLLWLRFYERDNSYIESYESHLQPINRDTLLDSVQKHLMFENFVIVAVGKQNEILEQLSAYGEVQCFKCRANPVKT
jgi:zinc protease